MIRGDRHRRKERMKPPAQVAALVVFSVFTSVIMEAQQRTPPAPTPTPPAPTPQTQHCRPTSETTTADGFPGDCPQSQRHTSRRRDGCRVRNCDSRSHYSGERHGVSRDTARWTVPPAVRAGRLHHARAGCRGAKRPSRSDRGRVECRAAATAAATATTTAAAPAAAGTGRCGTKRAAGVCVNSAVSEQELHRARAAQRIHPELSCGSTTRMLSSMMDVAENRPAFREVNEKPPARRRRRGRVRIRSDSNVLAPG